MNAEKEPMREDIEILYLIEENKKREKY